MGSPEDNICGICQYDQEEGDEPVLPLICGCFAHSDCMRQYIKANANVSMLRCFGRDPQCNHIITPEQIALYGTEAEIENAQRVPGIVSNGPGNNKLRKQKAKGQILNTFWAVCLHDGNGVQKRDVALVISA